MKNNFVISAFADEISPDVNEQIRVLKANEIHHVEVRGLDSKFVDFLTEDEARHYKKLFDDNGIKVSSIGSTIGKINIKDDFEEHLKLFHHVLHIAEIFESPYIRMFSFFIDEGDDPDRYEDEVIRRWKLFLEVAEPYENITLLHENEKDIYGDIPRRCLTLLKALNTTKVRAVFDPANFIQCDANVYPDAYQMLEPYIEYMHIKDARFSDHEVTVAGEGDGRVADVLNALVDKGFHGFASVEPHLALFIGFGELEKNDTVKMKEQENNEKLFNKATDTFKEMLVKKMNQEWV